MRILITGAAGRLGSTLLALLSEQAHDASGLSRDDLDVTDFDATRRLTREVQPDVVIHTAAWTDVDGCARDPERAIRVNGLGSQHVALAAAIVGAAVVYVSSNEIFDGRLNRAYYEYDTPNPANPYGYSKWVGEQAVKSVNPKHYIARTSWLFAHGGRNFVHSILNAARDGKPLRVVANEVANPTYTDDLAQAITTLITTERYGIYHLVNQGSCSRYQFARYVLDRAGMGDVPIEKISSFEWSRPSIPPPYCAMENLAGPLAGITMRPWRDAVDAFLEAEGLFA